MPDEPEYLLYNHATVDHAAAIGRAISAWAQFEFVVDEVIWDLARLEPEQGACLTAQYGTVAQRFDALVTLAAVQGISQKHIAKMNQAREKASNIAGKRNRIVHDPWFYSYDSKQHYRLHKTAKGTLDFSYKAVSTADVLAIEKAATDLITEFREDKRVMLHDFYSSP